MLVHLAHVGADLGEMTDWYRAELGAEPFAWWPEPNYLESEQRLATLLLVGDLCVEVMAPTGPGAIARFLDSHGPGLHSLAFRVDSLPDGAPYVFPSRRDTAGLRVELCAVDMPGDPRLETGWTPTGPFRLAYLEVATPNPPALAVALGRTLGAVVSADEIRVGKTVLRPVAGEETDLAGVVLGVADERPVPGPVAGHGAHFSFRVR